MVRLWHLPAIASTRWFILWLLVLGQQFPATKALIPSSSQQQRTFQFVENDRQPFQESTGRCSISCDGRIPGVTLELSHWNGNATPRRFYADTSTEMALQLPTNEYADAVVVNNHFDTDGVLSVFACLQPHVARSHRKLLIDAAEAGDFGEWSSDQGIQLDATLEGIANEMGGGHVYGKEIYKRVLHELPDILHDISNNQGRCYAQYWTPTLTHAQESYEAIRSGQALITTDSHCPHLVITREPDSWLARPAIHRALVEQQNNTWKDTYRILRTRTISYPTPSVRDGEEEVKQNYNGQPSTPSTITNQHSITSLRYEKPGHWWVSRLRDRHVIPPVQYRPSSSHVHGDDESDHDDEDLSLSLSRRTGLSWKSGGESLSCLCHVDKVSSSVDNRINLCDDNLVATIVEALQHMEASVLKRS